MRKSLLIIILTIFSCLNCFSQSNLVYVEYEHGQWLKNFSNQETLIASKDVARYDVQELKSIPKENRGYLDKSTNTINLLPVKEIKPTTLYKTQNSPLVYFDRYMRETDKQWFVADSLPAQNWELVEGETKEIQGYTCKKAKIKFRGSNLTAYYTTKIPVSFGPWKFTGSPGLILEITLDDNPIYYWKASKIIYPYKEKVDFKFDKKQYKSTYQKFIKTEEIEKEKAAWASINKYGGIGSYTSKRVGPEKVYEWETIKKEVYEK